MDEVHGTTVGGSIQGIIVRAFALVPGKLGYALSTNGINQAANFGQHGVENIILVLYTTWQKHSHYMKQNKL